MLTPSSSSVSSVSFSRLFLSLFLRLASSLEGCLMPDPIRIVQMLHMRGEVTLKEIPMVCQEPVTRFRHNLDRDHALITSENPA